jgi:hypothetical protein
LRCTTLAQPCTTRVVQGCAGYRREPPWAAIIADSIEKALRLLTVSLKILKKHCVYWHYRWEYQKNIAFIYIIAENIEKALRLFTLQETPRAASRSSSIRSLNINFPHVYISDSSITLTFLMWIIQLVYKLLIYTWGKLRFFWILNIYMRKE